MVGGKGAKLHQRYAQCFEANRSSEEDVALKHLESAYWIAACTEGQAFDQLRPDLRNAACLTWIQPCVNGADHISEELSG